MRVRIFGLRLLAAVLTALWTIAAVVVLLGYRPGGPIDGVVGVMALLPIAIGLMGLFWPPAARGDRAFAAVTWLGLGAALLLIPSIGGILNQVVARGPQTLLPSLEAAYPWLLALAATSLFGGLGMARNILGSTALRGPRLQLGVLIAIAATAVSGSLFAAAAIANDLALRDRAVITSRFGPTAAITDPPACADPIVSARTARLEVTVTADVDGRPLGTVSVHGSRDRDNVQWVADVATVAVIGQYSLVRVGSSTWTRAPRADWVKVDDSIALSPAGPPPPQTTHPDLDSEVLATALTRAYRSAAEERGLEFVEGARARHCRLALDGQTFQEAFPQAFWMSSRQDLHRWRGSLDYWVFLDGQVGQVQAAVNGEAQGLGREGLQANLRASLTATDRNSAISVKAPKP